MRLDVGSGDRAAPDHTTVDLYYFGADVQAEAWDLPYASGSVEAIRCHHVLEHIERQLVWATLGEFWRVLMPGGRLDVEVPDLDAAARLWLEGHHANALHMIYGGQGNPGNFHKHGFNTDSLRDLLTRAGFNEPEMHTEWSPVHEMVVVQAVTRKP